jgi:DNA-binding LacI/PurR family transcriptional regulator
MGARAATMLMDRIEGKLSGDPITVRIVPTLVIRDSTRPKHMSNHRVLTAPRGQDSEL